MDLGEARPILATDHPETQRMEPGGRPLGASCSHVDNDHPSLAAAIVVDDGSLETRMRFAGTDLVPEGTEGLTRAATGTDETTCDAPVLMGLSPLGAVRPEGAVLRRGESQSGSFARSKDPHCFRRQSPPTTPDRELSYQAHASQRSPPCKRLSASPDLATAPGNRLSGRDVGVGGGVHGLRIGESGRRRAAGRPGHRARSRAGGTTPAADSQSRGGPGLAPRGHRAHRTDQPAGIALPRDEQSADPCTLFA
jgi:hypothetical protein